MFKLIESNYMREAPKNMFIFFLLMVVMDIENEDQVSKREYYVSKILLGGNYPPRILWILGGGVLNPNNPPYLRPCTGWIIFLNT